MRAFLLVGAIVLLSGCVEPSQPQRSMQPGPRPSPPQMLHTLVLASPQGQGTVELRREIRRQDGTQTVTYSASGAIVSTDDLGQWRFAYTKTSLEGVGTVPAEWIVGLHAVAVTLTNTSAGGLEVDWEHSAFVDASGLAQRVIHRGVQLNQRTAQMLPSAIAAGATYSDFIFPSDGLSYSAPGRASLWNSPAVLERLRPGSGFSIVLSIKRGEITAPRTFRFSAVASAPAGGAAPAGRP